MRRSAERHNTRSGDLALTAPAYPAVLPPVLCRMAKDEVLYGMRYVQVAPRTRTERDSGALRVPSGTCREGGLRHWGSWRNRGSASTGGRRTRDGMACSSASLCL